MSPNTQRIAKMFELLSEREQAIISELIYRLLPDDVATPDDLAAIAKSQEEYMRGETVDFDDINWD